MWDSDNNFYCDDYSNNHRYSGKRNKKKFKDLSFFGKIYEICIGIFIFLIFSTVLFS